LDGIVTVLSGMTKLDQMRDNVSVMNHFELLSHDERSVLKKVVEKLSQSPAIPCTDCKYCIDGCPKKINIPGIFSAFNEYKMFDDLEGKKGQYKGVTAHSGKASDCIACGVCEGNCPQHIRIIEELSNIKDVFET
jgi:predicted aldo/keto reductase-like oxidoreductase